MYASIRVINNANNASALFEIFQCRICAERVCLRCRHAGGWRRRDARSRDRPSRSVSRRWNRLSLGVRPSSQSSFAEERVGAGQQLPRVVSNRIIFSIASLLFGVEKTRPGKRSARMTCGVNAKSVDAKYLQAAITFALRGAGIGRRIIIARVNI